MVASNATKELKKKKKVDDGVQGSDGTHEFLVGPLACFFCLSGELSLYPDDSVLEDDGLERMSFVSSPWVLFQTLI